MNEFHGIGICDINMLKYVLNLRQVCFFKPLACGFTMNTYLVRIYFFVSLNLVQVFECYVVLRRSILFDNWVESIHGLGSKFKP
jgi:hypothetical protein